MAVWGDIAHRSLIGLLVEGLPKYGYNKEIDEEGDRQGDGGLNQEVHVGFSDVRPAGPVYLSRLRRSEGRKEPKFLRAPPTFSIFTFLLLFPSNVSSSFSPRQFGTGLSQLTPLLYAQLYPALGPLHLPSPLLGISSPLIFLPVLCVSEITSLERPFSTNFSRAAPA